MNYKILLGFVWMILLVQSIFALKPAPASFYGYVTIKEEYGFIGSVIEVYDSNMVLCGSFIVKQEGRYGLLSCTGDDPVTKEDEGATNGDNLVFYVNNIKAITKEKVIWQSGVLQELNLFVGDISEIEPILEYPKEAPYSKSKDLFIKIVSLIGSIVLIFVFLKLYNKK